ncbi:hypothetical protein [Pseudoalteromonas xiamenensis]
MSLLTRYLKPSFPDKIETLGQCIKVISIEREVRLQAYDHVGRLILDSQALTGFDVTTNTPFSSVVITSDTQQKMEVWVSPHKMTYDAMSIKPSKSQSFVVDHFGLSQQLMTFDFKQASARVVCESLAWWVGGEGVDNETGIYVPAGKVHEHNSAAPLHAFIETRPDQKIIPSSLVTVNPSVNVEAQRAVICGDYIVHTSLPSWDTYYTHYETGVTVKLAEPLANPLPSTTNTAVALRGWDKKYLAFVDCSKGSIQIEKALNPYNANFSARSIVEKDGVIYVLGAGVESGTTQHPNKVITYSSGVWGEKACPAELLNTSVNYAFLDPYTKNIWLICSNGKYFVSDDNLVSVTEVVGLRELTGVTETPSFTDTAIIFTSGNDAFAYVRNTGQMIDIKAAFPNMKAVYAVGRQWIVVSENKLFTTDDMLKTTHVAYTHDSNFSTWATLCQMRNTDLLIWQKTNDKALLLKMSLEPDLLSPKAKFKVYKESF